MFNTISLIHTLPLTAEKLSEPKHADKRDMSKCSHSILPNETHVNTIMVFYLTKTTSTQCNH